MGNIGDLVEISRKGDFEMKTKLIWFVLIVFMVGAVGCDLVASSPEKTVNNYLAAVKKMDFDAASKYVKQTDTSTSVFNNQDDPEAEQMMRAMFSKMSHKTLSSKITGNTAQVVTSITSLDMLRITSSVMGDLLPMAFASAFSEGSDSDNTDQIAQQMFMSALSDPNAPMTTEQVSINLIKENGKWLILADSSLTNALTGNLGKLAEAFNGLE